MGDRRLAGGDVDGAQRAGHGRDRLHRGAHPQHLAGGHAALGAAGPAADARMPVGGGHDLVVGQRAGRGGELEAVADLDALDRLDAHQRAGEAGVEPAVPVHVRAQARRQPVDDTPRRRRRGCRRPCGPASIAATIAFDASGSRLRTGSSSSRATSSAPGTRPAGAVTPPSPTTCETIRARRPARGSCWPPGRGRPGPRSRGRRRAPGSAGLVEVVLLHADQVGVAGPGPGQRRVAGQLVQLGLVDRVGRHDLLPLGPLGVAHLDRDRSAHGLAVPDAAEDRDLVLLELHPGAAAVAEPAPGQGVGDVVGGDRDVGGQALEDRDQGRAVGLARGEPTQHARSLSSPAGGPAPPGHEMATTAPARPGPRPAPPPA